MGSAHRHGRKVKVLRSGRHTQPSQVEKVAEKAGKAAPVMAISAGALVAVPHGHAAAPARHSTVAEAVTTAKTQTGGVVSAAQALAIAKTTYANSTSLNVVTTSYQAKHAKTVRGSASEAAHSAHLAHLAHAAHAAHLANEAHLAHLAHLAHVAGESQSGSESQAASEAHAAHLAHLAHLNHPASHQSSAVTVSHVSSTAPTSHGIYGCSALESLWEEAGGSSGTAFMAAEIAEAESGGNPNVVSPTDDFGLWQINRSHGSMATLDPLGNARAAVSISGGGSNWGAWTTYTSGAYSGKC